MPFFIPATLSSPHPFFIDPLIDLSTSNSPPNTTPCPPLISELTQSNPISALPNLPSALCEEPKSTLVQRATQDYEETFASVTGMTSIRSLSAIVARKQWPLLQMDVKNVFLNGTLSEDIYRKPPPSTIVPPQKVCLLRRALYGLKLAARAWFAMFSSTITQLGFTFSSHDSALLAIHLVHFEMKDLETFSYFLDLAISSSANGYYCNQLVGSLIYLTVTRLDIVYPVHIVSQFMAAPRTIHFTIVLRILRYIKGTLVMLLSPGVARNNLLFPVLAQSLNIVFWLMPLQNYYDFVGFLLIWVPHKDHPLYFIVIIVVLFKLNTMMYFMNEQSTFRIIAILFTIIFRATLSISTTDQPADIFTKDLHFPHFTRLLHKLNVVSTLAS
ncbi:putative mitochondrial protein [Cucumis melo var. makuwa]|uniref:Putative mitochondrial protein n=1 Tax=Cucumis melo var. makuwa TaxID=1194695 RepID=A0A5D3CQ81_CUCMM|nr:putative mitochondrial protein [Cucumis melo var. makuwa]